MYLSNFFHTIIYFIFPPKCYICKTTLSSKGLCATCFIKLKVPSNYCYLCGFEIPEDVSVCVLCNQKHKVKSFDSIHFSYNYNDAIYSLISQFKYFNQLNLQSFLVNMLQTAMFNHQNKFNLLMIDVVIPVPMYYFRLIKRKYNHSALLAKQLAQYNHLYFNPFILKKCKHQTPQMQLSGKARLSTIKNSFKLAQAYLEYIKNKNVLLVDDVITTGATIDACCRILKQHGAKSVHVVAIAKVRGRLKV